MPQARQAVTAPKKKNFIVRFISDTIAEMKKVTWLKWPREVLYLTGLVLLVSVSAGIVLGIFDWAFSKLVALLVGG